MKDKLKLKGKDIEILSAWDAGASINALRQQYGVVPSSMRSFLKKRGRDTGRKIDTQIKALSVEDAAYIAGIMDGEGSIVSRWVMSRGRPTVQSRVIVGTTSRALASYLLETVGAGWIRERLRPSKPTWKPIYWWETSSWGGALLLKQLLPYLKVKRELASLYIELVELKAKSVPGRRYKEARQGEREVSASKL